jgi:endonuclease-3
MNAQIKKPPLNPVAIEIVDEVLQLLQKEYPHAKLSLNFRNPLELLVAIILSAQCPDERVNKVTQQLFNKYRTVHDYANANLEELEADIKSTGFYRRKARRIQQSCMMLIEKYDSTLPRNMDALTSLPGVARKTANMLLANAFRIVEGIAVDTHVRRIAQRLGFTHNTRTEKVERDLMQIIPRDHWFSLTYRLIDHGRTICTARKPLCGQCVLRHICPSAQVP